MLNFEYSIPTKIHFGRGSIEFLKKEIKQYGNKVLLVYGGGSIKKIGLYNQVVAVFEEAGIEFRELAGVKPNPDIESVRAGVKLCREYDLDMVLAVGGGSTIDCSKAIAAGVSYKGDPWDFCLRKAGVRKALPLGTILSLSATGSEMNGGAVISNSQTNQKLAMGSPLLKPKFSILDPEYTFSVPPNQTAAGTADIYSHVVEQYFNPVKEAYLQNRLAEAIFKTCIQYGPIAVSQPDHYEARSNLMWASSLALNGLLNFGKGGGDWAVHIMEHELSAIFDVTHGEGLAILTPYWMEYILDEDNAGKFAEYGENVFNLEGEDKFQIAGEAIKKTRSFFNSIGLPEKLRQVGVQEEALEGMAEKALLFGDLGKFKVLGKQDVLTILKNAF